MATSATPADRLRLALDLADFAERMLRQRLHREHPELSADDVERQIDAWYQRRPGAIHGDAEGTPGSWPRR